MSIEHTRWKVAVDIMNGSLKLYIAGQKAWGYSQEEAMERLRQVWERESQERLEAHARVASILTRAR